MAVERLHLLWIAPDAGGISPARAAAGRADSLEIIVVSGLPAGLDHLQKCTADAVALECPAGHDISTTVSAIRDRAPDAAILVVETRTPGQPTMRFPRARKIGLLRWV